MTILTTGYDPDQAAKDTPELQTCLTYGLTPAPGTYHLYNRLVAPPGYVMAWPDVTIIAAYNGMPVYGTPGVDTEVACVGGWGGGDYWITW